MRFTSGLSDAVNPREAIDAVCRQVMAQLAGQPCDVACVFASTVYRASWPSLLEAIHERLQPKVLIGCSGSGIIGSGQEVEWTPAVSLVAAHLPGVRVFPFVVTPEELDQSSPGGFWVDKIGASPEANPVFVVFADPFTTQPEKLVEELNATYRTRPIVGGLVSGGTEPGEHLLFMGRDVRRDGVVGVGLTGNIAMETVVAQGCRPIGRPMIVTKAQDSIVWELGGRQALTALHEVLAGLTPPERELAQRGSVFVGVAIDEMRQAFGSGDFLIRNIVGIDPDIGAIAVADPVEVGQTLQFQLRDPATSRQELRRRLQRLDLSSQPFPPAGGLLFNCTGRGKSLYGLANQDVKTIQTVSGKLPLGGFFCSGEIGPVGGTNFIHSYTVSLGLFRPLTVPVSQEPLSKELQPS